jgi:asparagine synthase (glutamine-hydrolysing)
MLTNSRPVERVVDLTDPNSNIFFNTTIDEARAAVAAGDLQAVHKIQGSFALVGKIGQSVRLARSLDRPLRYFIAKRHEGPCLVAADRIDAIHGFLVKEGLAGQFHPSYTRMVPAHHISEVALVGCPDPSPVQRRFFAPALPPLSTDVDSIAKIYVGRLQTVIQRWLSRRATTGPVCVCFSGGIDSGAVFLVTYHTLLALGESPSRLKAFTLSVDGEGADLQQARDFLGTVGLDLFLEAVNVPASAINWQEAVEVVEDYKPLDIQAAAMGLALLRGIRDRYPDWRYLLDGDGGDENLKDYPIHENPELTIRSVLNNRMLYQEGWGVESLKHSQTYSGGLSRGYVRTYAPARHFGFEGFSPFTSPELIEVAEAIPFIALTDWQNERLYALKGEILARGVKAVTGLSMPVFPKRRFQHGAVREVQFQRAFPRDEYAYRRWYHGRYEQPAGADANSQR